MNIKIAAIAIPNFLPSYPNVSVKFLQRTLGGSRIWGWYGNEKETERKRHIMECRQ